MNVRATLARVRVKSLQRRSASERYALAAFGLAIFLIVALAGLTDRALKESVSMDRWVQHSYAVLKTLDRALAGLSIVRTDVQAYLITGEGRDLARRESAVSAVISSAEDLKEMTADRAPQTLRASELDHAMRALIDQMTLVLVQRQTVGFAAARATYMSGINQALLARVDTLQRAMRADEARLLARRTQQELVDRRWLSVMVVALNLVVIATMLVGFAFLLREITTRGRLAASHAGLNATLEWQKSALEAANRELESFSYSVSHDLRAPLRAIDGFSLMLLEDYGPGMDAEAQRYIATIRASTQRMGQLIDDLLALSQVGRQPLRKAQVDMTQLAREAAAEAMREMSGPPPELLLSELPPACGDGSLLKQVWLNLIGNAVKYSSKVSAPRIEITADSADGPTVYRVRDNGAGFDMQFAHKLFNVFQRLHGQEEFAGTGVGLALVHRILTRHGGRIWAESAPERGATFHFTVQGASTA
jgi:signal transduction histidine kinase